LAPALPLWLEHAHVLAGSEAAPDRVHIAQREKRAPVARQRDRAQIAATQPGGDRFGLDAQDCADFGLGEQEGHRELSHALILDRLGITDNQNK
jgi:hypothetical protein